MDFTDDADAEVVLIIEQLLRHMTVFLMFVRFYRKYFIVPRRKRRLSQNDGHVRVRLADKIPAQMEHLGDIINVSDQTCVDQLRMDRNAFGRLCYLLENVGGLVTTRNVLVSEQVALFLSVLAHHKKNVTVKFDFKRSGQTISKHFNHVLDAVLRLYPILAITPTPVDGNCDDNNWKWFKGCLGALDGTYVKVLVPTRDKPRYRNRKGEVSVNVLGVCNSNMNYVFVLSGWEGSAADSRVLRDAVTRPNGLRIPTGNYYLGDCGYTNGPGFLTPYRGVRYHLEEWSTGPRGPQNYKELFNLRHAKARNVIERSFGIMKMRWAILRSPTFYSIKGQNKMIMACFLLHNFIRTTMLVDPMEDEVIESEPQILEPNADPSDYVDQVEPTQEWTNWRDTFAMSMYNEWRAVG